VEAELPRIPYVQTGVCSGVGGIGRLSAPLKHARKPIPALARPLHKGYWRSRSHHAWRIEIAGAPEFPAPGLHYFYRPQSFPPPLPNLKFLAPNGALCVRAKLIFNTVLKKRAYTKESITGLVAQSRFGQSEILLDPIGFDLWLHK
jgi:hypothetical protein